MKLAKSFVLVALLAFSSELIAQTPPPAATKPAFNSDWAYCTALTVSERFQTLYLPHALALMDAEKKLRDNASSAPILESLSKLPGVKSTVIADNRISPPNNIAQDIAKLEEALLNEARLFKTFRSPMMHKLLGGKCMWERIKAGDKKLDVIAHGFYPVQNDNTKKVVVAVVLDKAWFLPQIPTIMDSLARENTQLLFWGPSPTNSLWAQTLGIVAGKDTLWWQGPKDVTVECVQVLWPFESIEIHSHLHNIQK